MYETLKLLAERAKAGKPGMLVTIAGSVGSAPRGMGAYMAVDQTGRIAGTIGGGMLEYRAIETAQELPAQGKSGIKKYSLSKEEIAELGMVCGGNVDVLYTYIAPGGRLQEVYERVTDCLEGGGTGWLVLPHDGGIGFYSPDSGAIGIDVAPDFNEIERVKIGTVNIGGKECFVQKIFKPMRVFVFGGGHLSQEIVPLLSHLGFECTVTDDRPEYSDKRLFPTAREVKTLPYSSLDGEFDITSNDCVIAVTQGHAGDYDVQKFALKTPAGYIGAVGSKTKIAHVNQKLKNDGFTQADIDRVTSPIGLPIKSQTPAEIAVSVAAQLIKHRAEFK